MKNCHFERFLDAMDAYLIEDGWYINGKYIREKCKTFEDVEQYLFEHCYSRMESKMIVASLKLKTLNEN